MIESLVSTCIYICVHINDGIARIYICVHINDGIACIYIYQHLCSYQWWQRVYPHVYTFMVTSMMEARISTCIYIYGNINDGSTCIYIYGNIKDASLTSSICSSRLIVNTKTYNTLYSIEVLIRIIWLPLCVVIYIIISVIDGFLMDYAMQ